MTRVPTARHIISETRDGLGRLGRTVPGSYSTCERATIVVDVSNCTYCSTRASLPLRRMRTQETQKRSSYHRLALRKRLDSTAKSSSSVRQTYPTKTRRATRTDFPVQLPSTLVNRLRSATFPVEHKPTVLRHDR